MLTPDQAATLVNVSSAQFIGEWKTARCITWKRLRDICWCAQTRFGQISAKASCSNKACRTAELEKKRGIYVKKDTPADNVVFHLAVADPGTGPVLLYWTDLDSAAKTITVRGRLITGKGKFTDDFVISQSSGQPASFALGGGDYWYGDYHTAGGYATKFSQTAGQGKFSVTTGTTTYYEYYPMWVEPINVVR